MKLKAFEEFVNEEINIEDPEIAKKMNHFYELQRKIQEYEQQLEEMKDEFKGFEGQLRPIMDGMKETGEKLAKTEDFIVQITRFGGERKVPYYKDAFENALTKVNAATQKVLLEALEASKKVTQVKHSFKIDKALSEASFLEKVKSALKSAIAKLTSVFKKENRNIDDANKELAKLAKNS